MTTKDRHHYSDPMSNLCSTTLGYNTQVTRFPFRTILPATVDVSANPSRTSTLIVCVCRIVSKYLSSSASVGSVTLCRPGCRSSLTGLHLLSIPFYLHGCGNGQTYAWLAFRDPSSGFLIVFASCHAKMLQREFESDEERWSGWIRFTILKNDIAPIMCDYCLMIRDAEGRGACFNPSKINTLVSALYNFD
jgi:hypothetical protein